MTAHVQEVMDIICLNTCDKGKYGVDHQAIHDEIVQWHNANLAPIAPPKPEEPTNWLAVVEDSAGAQWYRVTNGAPNTGAWARRGQEYVGAVNVYRDVTAVKILSEGVQ